MNRCKGTTSKGEQCKLPAVQNSDYCKVHLSKNKVEEQKEKSDIPSSVPAGYEKTYETFYNSVEPTELKHEQAMLRTLVKVVSDQLNGIGPESKLQLRTEISNIITKYLQDEGVDRQQGSGVSKYHAERLIVPLFKVLNRHLPEATLDVKAMSMLKDLLELIRKYAESIKKIQEGFKLTLEVNLSSFQVFIQQCVLPNVKDVETRMDILKSAQSFYEKIQSNQNLLEAPMDLPDDIDDLMPDESGGVISLGSMFADG